MDALNSAALNLVNATSALIPGLIAAVLVFLLGWIIAIILSRIVLRILKALKFEEYLKANKVEDALGTVKLSDVLAKIVKYYVILVFLQAAVSLVYLGTITNFMTMLLMYVPVLVAGVLVVLASVLLGEYAKESISELSKSTLVKLLARITKAAIVIAGITMGLATAGFNTTLLTGAFISVIQAVAFGLALAFGLAFGLGGQEDAKDLIKNGRRQLKV